MSATTARKRAISQEIAPKEVTKRKVWTVTSATRLVTSPEIAPVLPL